MVIDTLENLEKYATLNPLFKDVCNFLKNNDLNALKKENTSSRRKTSS